MRTELRVKWLLYILHQNRDRGFTFWELIIILFILGLLVAIALPSFLPDTVKDKQAEPKQYVSSINKAQQAYYTENGTFVTENTPAGWASLAVGIKTQTANYKYLISSIGEDGINAFAIPLNKNNKGYTGVVGLFGTNPRDNTTQAIVCETNKAGEEPIPGEVTATEVKCGSNSHPLR
ncbi:type IV pilin-like G/H family protein [Floridanema aerugineum]|uniref:Type IV pilin-like G/H family protein n=1 Tax=Floridaenema aerugineum BLCC-F46 TaxID=3153654 RepID=A0ABV4XBW7_9CYAN